MTSTEVPSPSDTPEGEPVPPAVHESAPLPSHGGASEPDFDESSSEHEQAADAYLRQDQSVDDQGETLSHTDSAADTTASATAASTVVSNDDLEEDDYEDYEEEDDTAAEVSLKGKRILLIEDDREFAAGITENLKDLEVGEVLYASNAETGLSYLADPETFPDVIVLELALIGMDGIQFLAQLRANPRKRLQRLPAVVITMLDSPSIYRRAANQKVGAFLRKPVSVSALRDGLHAALRGEIVEKPFSQPKSWLDDVDEEELQAKREANIAKASAKAQKQGFLVRLLNALIPWSGKA